MIRSGYQSYRAADVGTADRGKLILMVYDHCIKWCKKSVEELEGGDIAKMNLSVTKVQDGLTELMCSLDFDQGGEIAKNLYRLYEFYGRHLGEGLKQRSPQHFQQVMDMLLSLRDGWVQAIENVRKEGGYEKQSRNIGVSMTG